jgi:hypothetical protein
MQETSLTPTLYGLILAAIPTIGAVLVEYLRTRDRQRHREALLQARGDSSLVAALELETRPNRVPNSTSVLLILLGFGFAAGTVAKDAILATPLPPAYCSGSPREGGVSPRSIQALPAWAERTPWAVDPFAQVLAPARGRQP